MLRDHRRRQYRRALADIETYCMFIGYPRSGHSLIGSLLDAHENIMIAHEANALMEVEKGIGQQDLYLELCENSWQQSENTRQETGYSYAVPGQWQGRSSTLRVIGDKKGGRSSTLLAEQPQLLGELRKTIGDHRLRVLHVMRHPLDNISTILARAAEKPSRPGQTLRAAVDFYFSKCDSVAHLRDELGKDLFDLRLEAFITEPREMLERCCEFLGVEAGNDYLEACAKIVYSRPNKTRKNLAWPDEMLDEVHKRMLDYEFLDAYSKPE
jgi:hypothetical protein